MFLMIVIAVFMHQVSARLHAKSDIYPLRSLLLRIVEITGKVGIIPAVVLYFFWTFTKFSSPASRDVVTALVAGGVGYVFVREITGFKADVERVCGLIRVKMNSPASHNITSAEGLVLNWVMFRIFSRSMAHSNARSIAQSEAPIGFIVRSLDRSLTRSLDCLFARAFPPAIDRLLTHLLYLLQWS